MRESMTVGLYLGRFQPLTLAHSQIIDRMSKENDKCVVLLVKGKHSSKDKDKNPFDTNMQEKLLDCIRPSNVQIVTIPTGFFVDYINEHPLNSFKLYCGEDRNESYKRQLSYLENDKNVEIINIDRKDDISATKLREGLRNGTDVSNLIDKRTSKYIEEMRDIICS